MNRMGIVALAVLFSCSKPSAPPSFVEQARASARRHAAESLGILDLVGHRIADFFTARETGVDRFIDEAFGFRGKWRAVFWGREDFERHLRRRFEACVFGPEDFERDVVARVREDLEFAMEAGEARVAADLWAGFRGSRPPLEAPRVRAALVEEMAPLVARDLEMNLVSIGGSEVAAALAAMGLARAGLFGVSVAAGASQSWWNFGIGLIVGAVVGVALDAAVGEDVEREAKAKVQAEVARIRMVMLDGDDGLWHAARRALELHGRVLEEAAVRWVKKDHHAATRG
ncbi:MAG: hypothetical protein HY716_03870 [Planctomycetes bacterium]|nr:hypothetical protein [Planctomycetota bacterium]